MKSYEARIARLERILGPRSQKAALLLLVDLLVQAKKAEERQERRDRNRPPGIINPDGGAGAVQWRIKPAGPDTVPPPPAFTGYCATPLLPVPPAAPVRKKKTVRKKTVREKTAPVTDMCVFPAHWQSKRGLRMESDDEQRRRVPPRVF